MTTRRQLVRLLAAAPLVSRAVSAAPDAPDAAAAAPPDAGPYPTAEKLASTNRELLATLGRVRLANGDGPDLLPRPPLPAPAPRKVLR